FLHRIADRVAEEGPDQPARGDATADRAAALLALRVVLAVIDGDAAGHAADGCAEDPSRHRTAPPLPVAQRAPGSQKHDEHRHRDGPELPHTPSSSVKRLAAGNAKPKASQEARRGRPWERIEKKGNAGRPRSTAAARRSWLLDDDLDAAVLRASLGRGVVRDRAGLAVAPGREAARLDAL